MSRYKAYRKRQKDAVEERFQDMVKRYSEIIDEQDIKIAKLEREVKVLRATLNDQQHWG